MSFGGKTSRICCYEIMKHLFSDDVLMNYTWGGTAEKVPFKQYKINDVIKKCVRVHFPEYTDAQYKEDTKEHLKHAPTRVIRRYF